MTNPSVEMVRQYDYVTGVPDSDLAPYIAEAERADLYHPAPAENHAVAMAFGATLTGARALVLMQNSGLGRSLNALIDLFELYEEHVDLLVAMRGEREDEEPQHRLWPVVTEDILQTLSSRWITVHEVHR